MSVRVIAMVFEAGPEDLAQHSVMMALADNADDLGVAWPGQELLARKSRQSVRNVARVLDALERDGWLVRRKRTHGEHRRGNVYEMNLARLAPAPKPVHDTVSGRRSKRTASADTYAHPHDRVSPQETLPAETAKIAPRDLTSVHRDMTMTPPRPAMALADLLLADGVAFQNRHRTTNEPSSTPIAPACWGMGEAMNLDPETQADLDAVNALRAQRGDGPLTADELWPERNTAPIAELPESPGAMPIEPESVNAAPVLAAIRAVGQPRLERVVRAAVAAWCTREGRNADEGVAYAVGQARKFLRDGELMRHGWTWKRFFGDGYWASESLWPYDQGILTRLRQSVGGSIGARHEGRRDHRR